MIIEETLNTYETLPKETEYYISLVYYEKNIWLLGPSGVNKQEVIELLKSGYSSNECRIYTIKLPIYHD